MHLLKDARPDYDKANYFVQPRLLPLVSQAYRMFSATPEHHSQRRHFSVGDGKTYPPLR